MGLSVVTNTTAMTAYRHLGTADQAARSALERLSSGLRINRAADDAAGLAVSEGLRAQIGGMRQAVRNTQDGISVVRTAEGVLAESTSVLQRMRDLAVQAANRGGLGDAARSAVQAEIAQLKEELTRIADATTFHGTRLLDGTLDATFLVGADAGDTIDVRIGGAMGALGLGVARLDVTRDPSAVRTVEPRGRGQALGGGVAFLGATVSPTGIGQLRGVVTVGGVSIDLGAVPYVPGPGVVDNATALAQLNAYAVSQGATWSTGSGDAPFIDDGDDLLFRSATPADTDTAADLGPLTPAFTPPVPALGLSVDVAAPVAAPPPAPGALVFTRTSLDDLPTLRGSITVGGRTLDLDRVVYSGAGGAQALAELNAAAKAAGITTEDDAFALATVADGSADDGPALVFTGPVPAGSTPADLAAATPGYTPGLDVITVIDRAISAVSTQRAELGAVHNRFEHTVARLGVSLENATAAESRIRDTDMAAETARSTRAQVLTQAGTAMLAQANQSAQSLLTLLRA
ncbi:flagellin [Modestobacter sp. SSW1-42]|uniref:flagellin N-terminal helical domain-containing protein n=1 Tax=Modestobacter sp. SSW1-42 TaxID=596372 RepID=UPI003987F993